MKIQKLTALALALALLFSLAACGAPAAETPVEATEAPAEPTEAPVAAAEEAAEAVTVRLAALTGPTAMGMAKLFSDADAGTAANDYEYALYGAADELTPQLLQGGVDIAAVPLNLASVLYNKTSGGVKLCAVGVLGVLYITEFNGETVQSLAELKGKTVYATGKGSTPEYFLRYLLAENGLDLDTDVTVEWKSEPSEVVALLKAENGGIAMLPQPYVTAAAAQLGEGFRAAVSLSEAWDALDNGSRCVTAGIVVRTEFAEAHPEAVEAFLAEMAESVDWVNADPADARRDLRRAQHRQSAHRGESHPELQSGVSNRRGNDLRGHRHAGNALRAQPFRRRRRAAGRGLLVRCVRARKNSTPTAPRRDFSPRLSRFVSGRRAPWRSGTICCS